MSVRAAVQPSGISAGIGGVKTCGSVWSCPVCASKILHGRTDELETAIRTWADGGGSFALATLTIRHHKGQALATVWDTVQKAWRSMTESRAYKDLREALGVEGYHRTTEVTYGAHGWHVHLHVLLFTGPTYPGAWMGSSLLDLWGLAVSRVGGTTDPQGQDWKILHGSADALAGVAGYVTKGDYRETHAGPRDARLVALELTRSDLKGLGRKHGSVTPFRILGTLVDEVELTGAIDMDAAALWAEWEAASVGRRQQTWSRGFRDQLGLMREQTDEELAAETVQGEDLVMVAACDWRRFSADGRREAALLDAIESAGSITEARVIASAFLAAHGVPHTLPEPPP
ncbi:MAG: protein rep [Candidatus Nanopelagicales bacterium]